MQVNQIVEQGKPYAWGAAGGIALTLIVEFAAGWVVTSGTMREAVTTAKVEQLAAVCAEQAKVFWTSKNRLIGDLQKFDAWEQREDLAERFSAKLPEVTAIKADVIDECADMISS